MDPYLEPPGPWKDVHRQLAVSLRQGLYPALPEPYYILLDEDAVTDYLEPEEIGVSLPDTTIGRRDERPASAQATPTPRASEISAPVVATLSVPVPARRYFLEIRKHPDRRLVTVIEILSPANKRPGRDRDAYLQKRDTYLASQVHFLELDFLRSGDRWEARGEPQAAYRVLLSRRGVRHRAEVWPIALRQSLPVVAVPLERPDPDVALDLQQAMDRAYDEARYDRVIDYRGAVPPPPLSDDDARWARERVAAAGRA
jgi:hypothetical protein